MEEIKRLRSSRRGFRAHLSKIVTGIQKIVEQDPSLPLSESDVASLSDFREQLKRKKEILIDLDAKIANLTEREDELEAEIFESEEIQETISQQTTRIMQVVEQYHRRRTHAPPIQLTQTVDTTNTETRQQETQSEVNPELTPSSQLTHTSDATTPGTVSIPREAENSPETQNVSNRHQRIHDPPTAPQSIGNQSITRLPKLNIPVFSGDSLNWQSFWDCFEAAIHCNPSLTGVQKLNYLRAQLQGDASRVVAGFTLTSANYEHSVTLLRERYGQPHKLINAHMQALLDLTSPTNSLAALQLFHDSVESHIRSLSSLGKSHETYGSLLVPIILGKLPTETRRNIARDHGNDEWTIDELQDAVLKEIRILEMGIENPLNKKSDLPTPTASFHTGSNRRPTRNPSNPTEGHKRLTCVYCKGSHAPISCNAVKEHQKRLDIIKRDKLCYNCLGHHKVSECNSRYRCRKCNRKHHTSICNPTGDSGESKDTSQGSATENNTTTLSTLTPSNREPPRNHVCLLKTAIATVTTTDSEAEANILFDEGSQRSFLTQDLANLLSLQSCKKEDICLSSFGAKRPLSKRMEVALINIKTQTGGLIPISVLIVPTIATPLKSTTKSGITQLPYLKGLPLAHPVTTDGDFKISLLIGADYYWDIVEDHIVRGNGPTAMASKLGYLLSGPLSSSQSRDVVTNILHVATQHDDDECNLQRFWNLEATGTEVESDIDKKFLDNYSEHCITRLQDGSYCARLPWKENHPPLPSNFNICWKRTRSLAYRLSQTPELLCIYNGIIADQLKRGFIELVDTSKKPNKEHYIPHHCVKRSSATTPIRIVYDCSCRQSDEHPSLNDCLLTGPHFLNDLCSILLRFRTHNYAISTDIEKAFLHINLHKEDRDCTRFFWLQNPTDPNSEFVVYRFKSVLFGAVSSPFILYATLYHHLQHYNTPISNDIQSNLYVDNIVSGCETQTQTVEYFHRARDIMSSARFNLRAWVSNSQELSTTTQQHKIADSSIPANVLGIHWNTTTDKLSLIPKEMASMMTLTTKREVLQGSSKIFDPMGLTSPVTIRSKLLMQKLWQRHTEWDEPLDNELHREWQTIVEDIKQLPHFTINRSYFTTTFDKHNVELHLFADASAKAYGSVAFLLLQQQTSFVMAKTRVAPLKPCTLPRLELMATVVAARLAKFIITSLKLQGAPTYIWTDSQIVLYWIHSFKRLPQFVSSRVAEINQSIPSASWNYCPTNDNPADLLTRGLTFEQFKSSSQWVHGPSWLPNQQNWPVWQHSPISHLHAVAAVSDEFIPSEQTPHNIGLRYIIKVKDYSTLHKLLTVTAYVYRFVLNLRNPQAAKKDPITARELHHARKQWIKDCQQETYWHEIQNISPTSRPIKRLLLVRQLRLFLDKEGLIRCGGRIHNAPLSHLAKFPYLLPQKHPFTALIIYSTHVKLYHTGINSTVTALRQSYWVPAARQYVKSLLRRCTICKRHHGRPYPTPDPAPLPKSRTQDTPPFTVTGVDFTGALYVQQKGDEIKVYICLFTCATTRAIHLEVVSDLSTETFLLAFRRFASRKSLPQLMVSDNASTYTAAAEELYQIFRSRELATSLEKSGVTWKFIPKKAPWYGGFWERLIGLTKGCIKKVLGRSHISLVMLQTMVVEIEATLNNRPLTYVSSDISDPHPLTPSDLLYGRRIVSLPHELVVDELKDPDYGDVSEIKRRAKTQAHLIRNFQTRWRHEYLTSLREFHRASGNNLQQVKVGDVVLIHGEGPRINWKLAVIHQVVKGKDGLIRAAEVRTANGTTNRPIAKLYPLEVTANDVSSLSDNKVSPQLTTSEQVRARPVPRDAASKARQQLSEWCKILRCPPEDVEI